MAAGGASEEKKTFDWGAALKESQKSHGSNTVSAAKPISIQSPERLEQNSISSSLEDKTISALLMKKSELLSDEEKFERMIGSAPGTHDWRRHAMKSSGEFIPLRTSRSQIPSPSIEATPVTLESSEIVVEKHKPAF